MARRFTLAVLALISIAFMGQSAVATVDPPEYRSSWVFGFGSEFANPSATATMINTLADNNFNVVVPEIRKAGDAYYNSAYEPWATDVEEGYDPLADMIEKAHARNMEVWGWIVTYRIWQRSLTPPPTHIIAQHPEWKCINSSGSNVNGSYYNLDPGVPGVQQYICDVVKDIVSKYPDLDGFNFDYIRYDSNIWGYNPISKERFKSEYGYYPPTSTSDAHWATWCTWKRRQITDFVKKCYLEATYINPHIKMTVDTIGWMGGNPNTDFTGTRAYSDVCQDHKAWMVDGIIDVNILMNYKRDWTGLLAPTYRYNGYYFGNQQADHRLWSDWLGSMQTATGRHSIDGIGGYMNIMQGTLDQWGYSRANGIGLGVYRYGFTIGQEDSANPGLPLFSSGSTVAHGSETLFYNTIRSTMFQNPAPVPDMPWKSAPTTGIIFGQVTNATQPNDPTYQNWVYKGTVQITGPVTQSTETDATGTFGFLNLPPGTYTVSCSKSGFATRTYTTQTILAGDVLRDDFDIAPTGQVSISSPGSAINRSGKALFSLPYEPVNPAPASVMGSIPIDGLLIQWHRPTQSSRAYDEWDPGFFGNLSLDQGYWLTTDSAKTIAYQAYPGYAGSRTQSLPKAGWNIIGCPFPTDTHKWADMRITNGPTTVSMEQARSNGWVNSVGVWWDSENQSSRDVGLPDEYCYTDYLLPWHGVWLRTYVDNLTLTQR